MSKFIEELILRLFYVIDNAAKAILIRVVQFSLAHDTWRVSHFGHLNHSSEGDLKQSPISSCTCTTK